MKTSSDKDERKGKPSASSYERYTLCNGSWQMEQAVKAMKRKDNGKAEEFKDRKDEWAESGTRIHAALAGEAGAFAKLSKKEADAVSVCENRASSLVENHLGDLHDLGTLKEIRLWFKAKPVDGISARLDRLYVTMERKDALVVDFKSGWGDVTVAADNPQLRVQAVLAWQNIDRVPERVVVAIVPPHKQPTVATFTSSELAEAEKEIAATLAAINAENPDIHPGRKQCSFCPASMVCAVRRIAPLYDLRAVWVKGEGTTKRGRKTIDLYPIPPRDMAMILPAVSDMRRILDEVEAEALRQAIRDPGCIPGYVLEDPRSMRSISSSAIPHVSAECSERFGIKAMEFLSACKVSLGKLEHLIAGKMACTLENAKALLNTYCGQYIVNEPGENAKPRLVKGKEASNDGKKNGES